MDLLDNLLEVLAIHIDMYPDKYLFPPQKNPHLIEQMEKELNIFLPTSYKQFLSVYDGGFINLFAANPKFKMELADARWNSNYLLSASELYSNYIDLRRNKWKIKTNNNTSYPFIPFCQTMDNERLVFTNPLVNSESYIFDALHDTPCLDWGILYFDFADFFADFIEHEGDISFSQNKNSTTLCDFLDENPYTKLLYFS